MEYHKGASCQYDLNPKYPYLHDAKCDAIGRVGLCSCKLTLHIPILLTSREKAKLTLPLLAEVFINFCKRHSAYVASCGGGQGAAGRSSWCFHNL